MEQSLTRPYIFAIQSTSDIFQALRTTNKDNNMFAYPSTPQGIHANIKNIFKMYRASFKFVLIFAFAIAAMQISKLLYGNYVMFNYLQSIPAGTPPQQIAKPELGVFYYLLSFLISIAGFVFFNGLLYRMHSLVNNRLTSIKDSLTIGLSRLLRIIAANILMILFIFVCAGVFIFLPSIISVAGQTLFGTAVPVSTTTIGVLATQATQGMSYLGKLVSAASYIFGFGVILYLFVRLWFFYPLIMIDDLGVMASLKRSFHLVKGNWWRTALPFIIFAVMWGLLGVAIVSSMVFILKHFAFMFQGMGIKGILLAQGIMFSLFYIFFMFIMPFSAAIPLVLLNDLKLREGAVQGQVAQPVGAA